MRELRFRIWDGKKIIYPDEKLWYNKVIMKEYKHPQDIQISNALKSNELIIMQFIGLRDKNRKEIYEGDILFSPTNPRWFNWLIEIIDGSVCLINIGIDGYRHHPILLIKDAAENREIIGNIYSNPELLK